MEERENIKRNLAIAANTEEANQGFTAEEEESIRRSLIAAVQNHGNNLGGFKFEGSQGGYSQGSQSGGYQGGYAQGGYGNGGQVVRVRNRTREIVYDGNGNIISDTSTEYGDLLGHEGEAGSSFNK